MGASQPAARLHVVPAPPTAPTAEPATRSPRLRSPLARAVVPVLGGAAVLGLIFLATWGMAVLIAGGDADSSERLAPTEFELGSVERFAEVIAEEGPIVLPDLNTTSGERTLVVDHRGDDPTRGWVVYWGFPAGGRRPVRSPRCAARARSRTATVGRSTSPTWNPPPACCRSCSTTPAW